MNRQHLTFLLIALTHSFIINAQRFVPVDKGSKIEFKVNYHKDGNEAIKGAFHGIRGQILFDPAHLDKSAFDVTVNAGSIKTGLPERDKELMHESYFSQSLYPLIHIKSTSITTDGNSGIIFILHGNLTLKSITKPINIQFTATPIGNAYLFRGSFHLNRLDFNIGEKGLIDNDVSLFIEVRAEPRKGTSKN